MLQLLKTSKTELDIGKILLHNFCPNFRVSNHRDSIVNEWSFAAVSTNQIASEREMLKQPLIYKFIEWLPFGGMD